jgi:hypothetical protein
MFKCLKEQLSSGARALFIDRIADPIDVDRSNCLYKLNSRMININQQLNEQ